MTPMTPIQSIFALCVEDPWSRMGQNSPSLPPPSPARSSARRPTGAAIAPYFYTVFLILLLVDRAFRDDTRCRAKYGKHWDKVRERLSPQGHGAEISASHGHPRKGLGAQFRLFFPL